MSPLARSLLALACAALLHASSAADWTERVRARLPDINPQLPMVELKQGIVDPDDRNLREIQLQPFIVAPDKSTTDIIVTVPNKANKNEKLVGQDLAAYDVKGLASKLTLSPVTPGHHSPLKVHCKPGCPEGVLIVADQYAIKILG